jgi:hypothetical protein
VPLTGQRIDRPAMLVQDVQFHPGRSRLQGASSCAAVTSDITSFAGGLPIPITIPRRRSCRGASAARSDARSGPELALSRDARASAVRPCQPPRPPAPARHSPASPSPTLSHVGRARALVTTSMVYSSNSQLSSPGSA